MDAEKQRREPQLNEQTSAEYWQAKLECLQEMVCLLLIENQAMRAQQRARE